MTSVTDIGTEAGRELLERGFDRPETLDDDIAAIEAEARRAALNEADWEARRLLRILEAYEHSHLINSQEFEARFSERLAALRDAEQQEAEA